MSFIISGISESGHRHTFNQDSVLVQRMQSAHGEMAFACICDGMGGLQHGELASATLLYHLSEWADTRLPDLTDRFLCKKELTQQWSGIISESNAIIRSFSLQADSKLGTTLTAALFWKNRYFIANIGDTRVYEIGKNVRILTRDHTYVRQEIDAGRMTPEQAAASGKEHILTRCVGVNECVHADFYYGKTQKKALYLLCSDGFRHKIQPEEMKHALLSVPKDTESQNQALQTLLALCRKRGEKDDISAVTVLQ